jgi:hypothetical protein
MGRGRLEAFGDGVLDIIITCMVLELRVPAGEALSDLRPLAPVLFSCALSFVFIATCAILVVAVAGAFWAPLLTAALCGVSDVVLVVRRVERSPAGAGGAPRE